MLCIACNVSTIKDSLYIKNKEEVHNIIYAFQNQKDTFDI